MIAFGLIRVGLGKEGNRLCKRITAAQVAADLGRVSGAGMCSRKSHGTQPGVLINSFLVKVAISTDNFISRNCRT